MNNLSLLQHHRLSFVGLFLALLGWFLLTSGGHIYVKDGGAMFFMSVSLLDHGWFDVPLNINTAGGKFGPDGRYYTPFGLLQPLLAAPLVRLGYVFVSWTGVQYLPSMTVTWFNALVTAALCALMARFLAALGATLPRALFYGAMLGLSTPFWIYSRTFFAEPLTALGILASAWHLYRFSQSSQLRNLVWSGLGAAVVLLARPIAGAALPALFLYLVMILAAQAKRTGKPARLAPVLIFIAVILLGISLLLLYNVVRFGAIMETGYDKEPDGQPRSFTLDPLSGLAILLFSPGKSIFIFAPLAIAALGGASLWLRQRQRRPEVALALIAPGLFLSILCRWGRVEGGVTWGPRLFLPVLPVMLLPLAALLGSSSRRWPRLLVLVLALLGIAIQTLGAAVNFATFIGVDYDQYFEPVAGHYQFYFNPIAGHWRQLQVLLRELPRLRPLTEQQAVANHQLIQNNPGDVIDVWWLHLWRDRVPLWFIGAVGFAQASIFLAGILCLWAGAGAVPSPPSSSDAGVAKSGAANAPQLH